MTSLVVASPVRLFREGLARAIEREDELYVAAACPSDQCLAAVEEVSPDMVLVDTSDPGALELVRSIVRGRQSPCVVALGLAEAEETVVAYAEAGVAAYVTREDSLDDLVAALRAAAAGDVRCSSRTAGILLRRVATLAALPRAPAAPPVHLTPREVEIASLMDAGLSNKQIAQELQIELPTVKNHVHHILEKLDVARRGEAAARLRARGMFQADELTPASRG
jgi:two-component system, NarL family, nitrate/nitrite response regulator NarL